MKLHLLIAAALALSGCHACGKSTPSDDGGMAIGTWGPPPSDDVPPASLGAQGIVVEQPKPGETLTGNWVAVTGWVDPKKYGTLFIVGGSNMDLYAPARGHAPVPTVPVVVRSDGRFVAPRVPLDEGANEIDVMPMAYGSPRPPPEAIVKLPVTAQGTTSIPATLLATPASGTAPLTVSLQALIASGASSTAWQWDFDGDGRLDATSTGSVAQPHVYSNAGQLAAMARTFDGTRWVYAVAAVTPALPPNVLADAAAQSPRALALDIDYEGWVAAERGAVRFPDGGCQGQVENPASSCGPMPIDDTAFVRAVVLADGDVVRVFDGNLHEQRQLTGLSHPSGVAVDALQRIYVADTGNARVVRFNPDGGLDTSFGDEGSLHGPATQPFQSPTGVAIDYEDNPHQPNLVLRVIDSGRDILVTCVGDPGSCATSSVGLTDVDGNPTTGPALAGISALANVMPNAIRVQPTPFEFEVADGTRLLGQEEVTNHGTIYNPNLEAFSQLKTPLIALTATTALKVVATYVAGADRSGVVHEWFRGTREARTTQFEFPVTALAVDPWGSWAQTRSLEANLRAQSKLPYVKGSGPIVMYVAGGAHVQRRVFSSVGLPTW